VRYLILFLLMSCSSRKWYRTTCNKHSGGSAMSERMLLEHLDKPGFSCSNNDAEISRIRDKKTISVLNKMENEYMERRFPRLRR
jgi:hypothetical protein